MQQLLIAFSALLFAGGVFKVDAIQTGDKDDILPDIKGFISGSTPEILSEIFNFKGGVDISDTLAPILVSLSRNPQEHAHYYLMLETFYEQLIDQKIAPEFLQAWMILSYILSKDKDNRDKGKAVTLPETITDCLDELCGEDVYPELGNVFHTLAPYMSRTMAGDEQAARKIILDLAKHRSDFQQLQELDPDRKMDILKKVNEKLQWLAEGGFDEVMKTTEKSANEKDD